jgi:Flp pilus assembly protein TadD
MSVVMKALTTKSVAEDQKKESKDHPKPPTGIHFGQSGGTPPPPKGSFEKRKLMTLRAWVLLGVLILAVGVSGGLYIYRNYGKQMTQVAQQAVNKVQAGIDKSQINSRSTVTTKPIAKVDQADKTADMLAEEARSLFASNRFDESLKRFQLALEKSPGDFTLHNDLALVFMKKDLYSSAEKHFSKALEINPDCAECYGNLGYLKTLLKENGEAETYLTKATVLKPEEPKFHFNIAVLYEKKGDLGKSAQHYQKFLDLQSDQNSEMAQKVRDRIYLLTGQ